MIYRNALETDANAIALLHADSWRRTYRGLFSDDFLDHHADADRMNVWNRRLKSDDQSQFVCVAEIDGDVKGFICVYAKHDPVWGALIDNLHVESEYKRQGVGTGLMVRAFNWLEVNLPNDPVYLWVMENNTPARQFYKKLGAHNAGIVDKPNPAGGGSALNCRYIWASAGLSDYASADVES